MGKIRTHRLSIFLLKEDVTDPVSAVKTAQTTRLEVVHGGTPATVFYKQSPTRGPDWVDIFQGSTAHGPLSALRTMSYAAVMLMQVGGRWFALVFGTGRYLLVPGTFVDDFGLRVTINTLPPNQVRSVDHTSFEGLTLQHRAQSSRAASCGDLGINVNHGLVKALTGNPDDPSLGGKMTGMDALTVSVPADLGELPGLLAKYLERYESTSYQTAFPWIDHLRAVRDKARKQQLDDLLVAKLRAGDRDRVWLAVPEILEQEDIEAFSYRRGRNASRYHDTLLPDFLATVDDLAALDIHDLTGRQVFGHRTSVPTMPKQWPVYRCLYAEIDQGADTFILYDGKWYRVRTDFVAATNAEVASYVVGGPALLSFNVDTHKIEKVYNAAAAAADPRLLNMDRRFVRVAGNDIEVCDLFGDDGRMVHVKRYKASDSLSHLFNQGEVPARLLVQHRQFRQDVASKLSGAHQTLVDPDAFRPADFTVVFAITSESTKGIAESLPFFSRMTFVRVAGTLRSYGYKVELIKIDALRSQPAPQTQAPSPYPAIATAAAASP